MNNISAQQHFKYSATLDTIKKSGFYRIELSPRVLARCQSGFGDLRLMDKDGSKVSYILLTENGAYYKTPMIDLPIIKKEKEADKQWHITLENTEKRSFDRIVLTLKGTSVNRSFTLSGSEDKKHWYGIMENFQPEHTMFDEDNWSLYFPSNNYRYFQVTLEGKDLLPIDIVKASVYSNKVFVPQFSNFPITCHFVQKDSSDKKSYFKITFDEAYPIEKMVISLGPVKFYKRHFTFYKSLKEDSYYDTIVSSFNYDYPIMNVVAKDREFWMVIDNNDNNPLKINEMYFHQYNRYLVAFLDSAKKYNLYFGDSSLAAPIYDIASFKDSIKNIISTISTDTIRNINTDNPIPKISSSKSRWILWVGIIMVLILLSGITFKMLKEIMTKENGGF